VGNVGQNECDTEQRKGLGKFTMSGCKKIHFMALTASIRDFKIREGKLVEYNLGKCETTGGV
jgi:hypothetical protein